MTDDVIEQGSIDPPDAVPKGVSWWRVIWERTKPVWWLRGILGAWALVAFADQLGFAREWLRVVHALASRWNEWMSAIGQLVDWVIPWSVDYQSAELNALTLLSVLMVPALISLSLKRLRHNRSQGNTQHWIYNFINRLTIGTAVFGLAAAAISFGGPGNNSNPSFANLEIFTVTTVAICAIGFLIMLYLANRTYFAAMVLTFSFLATLELIFLVPLLNDALQPVLHWIDPQAALAK